MSVASEFPPEVHIPERARIDRPRVRHLAVVPSPAVRQPSTLTDHRPMPLGAWCADEVRIAAAPLRLTRRGVAALIAATVAVAALLLLVAHASLGQAPADRRATPLAATSVTVQNGDTLWSIAQRVAPASDPRQVVDQLRRVNHLVSVDLSPGQTLNLR